jgi:hypothetical protein
MALVKLVTFRKHRFKYPVALFRQIPMQYTHHHIHKYLNKNYAYYKLADCVNNKHIQYNTVSKEWNLYSDPK